jgi:hypothetical protein
MPSAERRECVAVRRLITVAVVLTIAALSVGVLYQPWLAQWGSTATERRGSVVGDAIVAEADVVWTRAITIDAPPSAVWPWLVQMGVDKGGFYNYDWGEQLVGDPVHNATTIRPEWQQLDVGHVIHPFPGQDWSVDVLEPHRALVLSNPKVSPTDWSWATELRPLPGDRTRLVTRIRSHKGTAFSYALDPPDLILFPRLLTGLKQRAEGTLPGMPGTHTGRPLPLARLPVHWWAALAWVVGLTAFALAGRRWLGFGQWRTPRRHPHLTFWLGFVVSAGYLLMSDTPPVHFVTHSWGMAVPLGAAAGVVVAHVVVPERWPRPGRRRYLGRVVMTVIETGLFVLLPVTAVWQAATAQGWTTSVAGHLLVRVVAALAATGVAMAAWGTSRDLRIQAAVTAVTLAACYAFTGSGLAALLAAAVAVVIPSPDASPVGRATPVAERRQNHVSVA